LLVGSDYQEAPRASAAHSESAPIQTAYKQLWGQLGLKQTRTVGHLFPDSSNPFNQSSPLPPKFPYLCMQYTPIKTHSGMPTCYGGPLRHGGGSATAVTKRFRLPARYCFLSLVRSLFRNGDGGRSDSSSFLSERARNKNKNEIARTPPPPIRVCVCSIGLRFA